MTFRQKTSFRY